MPSRIARAIVLAAGRLPGRDGQDAPRPLQSVDGRPLLHRTLETLVGLGVTCVTVVVGHRADELRAALDGFRLPSLSLQVIENADWRRGSGGSLLAAAAAGALGERSLCILGDRPVPADVLADLVALDPDGAESVMLVDTDVGAHADLAGATKVKLAGGARARVVDVGADLPDFQAFDCGHALVAPAIVAELERLQHPTVSDGLGALAQRGLVAAHEVCGRDWRRVGGFGAPGPDPRATLAHVEGLLEPKDGRYVLLNPGPVNTTARVKSALVHHDVCHRDSDYVEVLVRVSRKLRRIFRGGPEHSVVLITGSGTAAMECAIASTIPPGKKLLCVDNGAFGERMWEIAGLHRLGAVHLTAPLGQPVRAADVAAALDADRDIVAVAMCHHETSVGVLNPVSAVGAVCRERDVLLLVDAVSSLGAEDLDVERDGIDLCWSSGNKCLHGVSGVSFLCVSPRVWPRIEAVDPRVYYLDLRRYRKSFTETGQTPFTPAVAAYFALDAACDEYLEDGAQRRQELYAARNRKLRDGLAALGLGFFVEGAHAAHSILTPRLPDGVSFQELYEDLKAAGFVIYDAKAPLKGRYFQVANMGDLSEATLDAFLDAFAAALARARQRRAGAVIERAASGT
jgi:2-aminoethylphosphonate-pyruvate transaminase